MIKIKDENGVYELSIPTSINEISVKNLEAITNSFKLPKHYCILALAQKIKLFDLCASINNNKSVGANVMPILSKISEEDSNDVNATIGDKIIITRTSLERSVQIPKTTAINYEYMRSFFNSNKNITKNIITKNNNIENYITYMDVDNIYSCYVILLEFKICPVNEISAAISKDVVSNDPFINYYK